MGNADLGSVRSPCVAQKQQGYWNTVKCRSAVNKQRDRTTLVTNGSAPRGYTMFLYSKMFFGTASCTECGAIRESVHRDFREGFRVARRI